MENTKSKKRVLAVVLILAAALTALAVMVAAVAGCAYLVVGVDVKTTDDLSYYRALSGETDGPAALSILFDAYVECPYDLPTLEELGPYEDCRFQHKAMRVSIFREDSYVLVLDCGEAYEAKKAMLTARFLHLENQEEGYIMPQTRCSLDGFDLYAVQGGTYPHEMLFIGCSDADREIAIVYYYDQDLDEVSQSLDRFILEHTGWSAVVG